MGYRTIIVEGEEYRWKVGQNVVDIRGPLRASPSIATVLGMTEEQVDRAHRKRYLSVRPSDIAEYIAKVSTGTTD